MVSVLFSGTNLRLEAPLINARLRKSFSSNIGFTAYSLGLAVNYLTYPVINFGNSIKNLLYFIEGKLFVLRSLYIKDYYNLVSQSGFNPNTINFFIGLSVFKRFDGRDLLSSLLLLLNLFNLSLQFFHIINIKMGRISAMEFGLSFSSIQRYCSSLMSSFVYSCGVDSAFFPYVILNKNSFIVFQGFFSTIIYYL